MLNFRKTFLIGYNYACTNEAIFFFYGLYHTEQINYHYYIVFHVNTRIYLSDLLLYLLRDNMSERSLVKCSSY